ncbi:TPA: hypothetical protein QFT23_005686 [Bacillus cereus]|nr:hypothetical protein [Bacillus cereus]
MSCSSNTKVICCGITRQLVQDCVECRWLVFNQTPTIIFQANKIVSASGIIEQSSSTDGMTKVDVIFSKGERPVKTFTLENQHCLAFTVIGFDTITLKGNSPSSLESASGSFSLTPRYHVF